MFGLKLTSGFFLLVALAVAQDNPLAPGVYRIGHGVSAPVPASKADPDYSDQARRIGLQGTVVLSIVVDENGEPRDIRIRKGLGLGLDEKATEAAGKWRFQPGMKDGQPVKVAVILEINFRLLAGKGWTVRSVDFPLVKAGAPPTLAEAQFAEFQTSEAASVQIALDVNDNGEPGNVHVVRPSANASFDDAAVRTVLAWRFHPAMRDGQPIAASGTVDLTFTAPDRGGATRGN